MSSNPPRCCETGDTLFALYRAATSLDEKRAALARWGGHILACDNKPPYLTRQQIDAIRGAARVIDGEAK